MATLGIRPEPVGPGGLKRLLLVVPTLLLVTVFVFGIVRAIPGDVVDMMREQFQGIAQHRATAATGRLPARRPRAGRPCRRSSSCRGSSPCLLYTSDAADERSSVDLGGRR